MIDLRRVLCAVAAAFVAVVVSPQAQSQGCTPFWTNDFANNTTGMSHAGLALEVFDDGTGDALFVGGGFESIGGMPVRSIAKWDGEEWSALLGPGGGGLSGGIGFGNAVNALAVFDDGSGPALYVGGKFPQADGITVNGIAKWDGNSWSALGPGVGTVTDLKVIDDGTGEKLYATTDAGQSIGGDPMYGIAKWDGNSWSPVSSATSWNFGSTYVVDSYDDGTGLSVYVGGMFNFIDAMSGDIEYCFAEQTGAGWSMVGSGIGEATNLNTFPSVYSMTTHDDGTGESLYIGGNFRQSAGHPHNYIARWNGSSWSDVGAGLGRTVWSLSEYNDGTGQKLAIGTSAIAQAGVALWDGAGYNYLGTPDSFNGVIRDLKPFDDGNGKALFATGFFTEVDGQRVNHIAKWRNGQWNPLGEFAPDIGSMAVFDDGDGPSVYMGGIIESIGGAPGGNIFGWDGLNTFGAPNLFTLDGGVNFPIWTMATLDDGSGEALYVGGNLSEAGGAPAKGVARWDGSAWSAVGSGLSGLVSAIDSFDDGSGPSIYAGGAFLLNGSGDFVGRMARWDGASWVPVGSGMNSTVFDFVNFDDGTGNALYAGGQFTNAGGTNANRVARWDGSVWSALGSGVDGDVWTMTTFDDGSGPALYIGGVFTAAGGQTVNRIAKWDGTSWSAVGPAGIGADDGVYSLGVFDDGSGPALYAGGDFLQIGGVAAQRIAKWDGTSWSAVGAGADARVIAMTEFDDPASAAPQLVVGGVFTSFDGQPAQGVSVLQGCPPPPCPGDTDGDGSVGLNDLDAVLASFGTSVGDPGFDPGADINNDGTINLDDLDVVLAVFGTSCS